MILATIALIAGLLALIWSAKQFVGSAVSIAKYFRISPLLIGMIIVGFGTSAPEIMISAQAAIAGKSAIALGNAYGSNIANIALILGVSALFKPITVNSRVLNKELAILMMLIILSFFLLKNLFLSRIDALILLLVFILLMTWNILTALKSNPDFSKKEINNKKDQNKDTATSYKLVVFWLVVGLLVLIISSKITVWGAVEIANYFGVSDVIIGLTIVAIGTSLPELAAAIAATLNDEYDIVLGNVLGSNIFNILAVVGIAGVIQPFIVDSEIIYRDLFIMGILTIILFIFGYSFKRHYSCINRYKAIFLLIFYAAYIGWLSKDALITS